MGVQAYYGQQFSVEENYFSYFALEIAHLNCDYSTIWTVTFQILAKSQYTSILFHTPTGNIQFIAQSL